MTANPASQPTTQDEVTSLICNIQRSADNLIPAAAEFTKNENMMLNTAWGLATSGIMIFNGMSGEGADPFYPASYEGNFLMFPSDAVEMSDWCLAHPQREGHFHYHSASPCHARAGYIHEAGHTG